MEVIIVNQFANFQDAVNWLAEVPKQVTLTLGEDQAQFGIAATSINDDGHGGQHVQTHWNPIPVES